MATYGGKLYWIGSHRLMHEMGQETKAIHKSALELEDEVTHDDCHGQRFSCVRSYWDCGQS